MIIHLLPCFFTDYSGAFEQDCLRIVSNSGRAFHRVIRNSSGQVSNLSFDVGPYQGSVIIHRQDLMYSDDQLNQITSSMIGRYRITLHDGTSFETSIQNSAIHYHTIRGQRVFVDLSVLEPVLAQMGIVHDEFDNLSINGDNDEIIPSGSNGNNIYTFVIQFYPNSITGVIGFIPLNDSNFIKSIKKIFPRPPGQ